MRKGLCLGASILFAATAAAQSHQHPNCQQVFPGVDALVAFANPDGTPRQPTAEELKAVEDAEAALHDYEWVASADKAKGIQTAALVDHRNPEKSAGRVVATIPLRGGGAEKSLSNFVLVSLDTAGEGINDTTARTPVGGNPGTTLGDQRLNAMVAALDFWAAKISSPVDIRVQVDWGTQTCGPTSTVLGSASAITVNAFVSGVPLPNTWYHAALANKYFGSDINASFNDINATFNKALDESCAYPDNWYYGLDHNFGSDIDFFQVFQHEMAHGLCFSTFVNNSTGVRLAGGDTVERNDCYMTFLFDETQNKSWPNLTNAERASSAINDGNLTWSGSNVANYITAHPSYLTTSTGLHSTSNRVRMYAPSTLVGGSSVSHWDEVLDPDELMEPSADPSPDDNLTQAALMDMGWAGSLVPVELDDFNVR